MTRSERRKDGGEGESVSEREKERGKVRCCV